MPPRKKKASPAPPALTDADVAGLRARVQAGEKPRVVVRAASAAVPAGTRGNIIRIGNPSEGEYIVVRLGRDEVPFAPSELGMSGRQPAQPAATKAAPAKKSPAQKAPATKTAVKAKSAPAAKTVATPKPVKRAAKRSTSRRALPPLVVTLRFGDGLWNVEASRGARRIAKPSAVRPGAVKAFADLLDEDTVREAITETIDSCRSVVEERAAALRAELHAAEATLKEYEARRR